MQDPEDSYDIYITQPPPHQHHHAAATEFIPTKPSLRLDASCFKAEAFCSFRSTLYMFQGFDSSPEGTSVASFDLSQLDLSRFDVKLEPSMLVITHCGLQHPKLFPSAVATPDGRVVVFSNNIMRGSGNVDFELYDPLHRSSRVLPGLPDASLKRGGPCWILGHTIRGKSTLFLQTEAGMFSLDFDSPAPKWERPDLFYGSGKIVGCDGPFYIIRDDLCFAPYGTHDIKEGFRVCANFPTCFPGVNVFRQQSWSVIPLVESVADGEFSYCLDNGDFYFCVVQTALEIDQEFGYSEPILMSIDVRHCNLNEYRESVEKKSGGSRLLRSNIINSFKFLLDAGEDSIFQAYDLFTF